MFFNKNGLNHLCKTFLCFTLIYLFNFSQNLYAQNNPYVVLENESLVLGQSCLTNKSDYSTFKLLKTEDSLILDSLSIQVDANSKNESFKTLQEFNAFDFKFWLLSNESFKSQDNLEVQLSYIIDGNPIEQNYTICLKYDLIIVESRGIAVNPDFVKLPVYFGTDRNYDRSNSLNNAFGTKRSSLKYGVVEVSIPHDHRIGEIESPSIWKFEFSEDSTKHVMLQDIKLLDKDKFFSNLASDIEKSTKKSTFLFVHGYNTSFSEAAKRTAQISYDLKFDGKAVFYSWPSQSSVFKYGRDEENIEWSRKNIKKFLIDYLTKSGAEEFYLVAHSMGNRGLTRAIVDVMNEKPELRSKIKEIILAAPDIDADVFKNDIAPQMVSKIQKPITLYVSSDDMALKASKLLHGNPRAGDAGETIVLLKGIETIDATGVDTSFMSHSYFADTNSIISDIFNIIQTGQRALNRKHLSLVRLQNNNYWKVKQ